MDEHTYVEKPLLEQRRSHCRWTVSSHFPQTENPPTANLGLAEVNTEESPSADIAVGSLLHAKACLTDSGVPRSDIGVM